MPLWSDTGRGKLELARKSQSQTFWRKIRREQQEREKRTKITQSNSGGGGNITVTTHGCFGQVLKIPQPFNQQDKAKSEKMHSAVKLVRRGCSNVVPPMPLLP